MEEETFYVYVALKEANIYVYKHQLNVITLTASRFVVWPH